MGIEKSIQWAQQITTIHGSPQDTILWIQLVIEGLEIC